MKELITIDAETLMETPMEKTKFLVDKILPQGLHILAGSPKIGKSWLTLWMCLQISKGEPVWGYKTERSEVLYLCLEDNFSRIQDRIFKITEEVNSNLHFAVMCETIENGLEEQIENFILYHPSTKLIVIDTLQKVRDDSSANANMYANDYKDINVLKQLADKKKIAILLVHHLRKSNDNDPLNMISGSTGISGATDANFILSKNSRKENAATLFCTGRDIEQRDFRLFFNTETCLWESSELVEAQNKKVDETIVSVIQHLHTVKTFTGTATELNEIIQEKTPALLKKKIIRYLDIINENGIEYVEKRTYEKREFSLIYDGKTAMTVKIEAPSCEIVPSVVSVPSADWTVINLDPSQVRDV